jgi:hypothetical protein
MRRRHSENPGIPEQSFLQGRIGRRRIAPQGEIDQLFLFITQLFIPHEVHLARNDGHADDHENGQAELKDDQSLAEQGASPTASKAAF